MTENEQIELRYKTENRRRLSLFIGKLAAWYFGWAVLYFTLFTN